MKQLQELRVFRERNGDVCKRPDGNEPELAQVLLRAVIQRVPCGRIQHFGILRQRKLHVSEAVFPVERVGILRLDDQRPVRALVNRVVRLHETVHAVRIGKRRRKRHIAAHGGDGEKVRFFQRVQRHDRNRIVYAHVAVQPDRVFVHFASSP